MNRRIQIREEPSSLERRADFLRAQLLDTIDRIERRAHELTNVRLQLGRHASVVRTFSIAGITLVGAGVALGFYRFRTRDERRRHQRRRAIRRAFEHPDRVASYKDRTFFVQLLRNVALGSLTFVAMQMAKRSLRHALPSLHEEDKIPRLSP